MQADILDVVCCKCKERIIDGQRKVFLWGAVAHFKCFVAPLNAKDKTRTRADKNREDD